jgi:hypothetical protein
MTTPLIVCTRLTTTLCWFDVQYSFSCGPPFERSLPTRWSVSDRPAGQQAHARDDTRLLFIAAAAIATRDHRR